MHDESTTQRSGPFHSDEHLRQYEKIVDSALHRADTVAALDANPHVNPEQLRTALLDAAPSVTAAAAVEYEAYEHAERRLPLDRSGEIAAALELQAAEAAQGAGWFPLGTALAFIVAGFAALLFLSIGYVLPLVFHNGDSMHPMQTVGWIALAMTVTAAAVGGLAVLIDAGRNRTIPLVVAEEVLRTRQAWHDAVLERGVLPFIGNRLRGSPRDNEPRFPMHSND
jgi:hypothetical protein